MTPQQEQAIRRHGENLLAIFPNATQRDPVKLCKRLRRFEDELSRLAEDYCNGVIDDDGPGGFEAVGAARLSMVNAFLCTDRVWFSRDPRGYALKIDLAEGETLHRDWGGNGIIAPEIGPDGN